MHTQHALRSLQRMLIAKHALKIQNHENHVPNITKYILFLFPTHRGLDCVKNNIMIKADGGAWFWGFS
jgi:hypothetical protein